MNAEKILTYIGWLLLDEKEHKIQEALTILSQQLSNLVSAPQEPTYQKGVADSLLELQNRVSALIATYDAVQWRGVATIGAMPYFSEELVSSIKDTIGANSMTPTIAQSYVAGILAKRAEYLENIERTRAGLKALSIKPDHMEDEAEIGFQIPRLIFHNNLDGLVDELRAIRRIIRAFSELASGSPEEIHVRQISTSDPIFYFGLGALTISQIGGAVTWALERWKQVEDIRKVRSETKKLKAFSSEEISEIFDKKIKEVIDAAVSEKTSQLVAPEGATGRKAEQRTDIAWALEALFARVERGMTVEIRFLAPEVKTKEDGTTTEEPPVFNELREINKNLIFPEIDRDPVLSLPQLPAEGGGARGRKAREPSQ